MEWDASRYRHGILVQEHRRLRGTAFAVDEVDEAVLEDGSCPSNPFHHGRFRQRSHLPCTSSIWWNIEQMIQQVDTVEH